MEQDRWLMSVPVSAQEAVGSVLSCAETSGEPQGGKDVEQDDL